MKLAKTAWRNIGRNGTRSAITATAVLMSALIVSLVLGFESGFVGNMRSSVIDHVTGDVRVMDARYVGNERVAPIQYYVGGTGERLALLSRDPNVSLATPKTEFAAAIWRNGDRVASRICGIDFATSRFATDGKIELLEGAFPRAGNGEALVPERTARDIGLSVGDKFTALARTASGGSNGKTFIVSGIARVSDTDYATRVFFVDWRDAGSFLRMGDNALAIQVFLKPRVGVDEAVRGIRNELGDGLDVRAWDKVGGTYELFALVDVIYAIIAAIFFALSGTVVFNTTMMSVLERRREIGALRALGMEGGKLVRLFALESVMIASIGAVAGLALGATLVGIAGRVGFDVEKLGAASVSGLGVPQVIYPSLGLAQFAWVFAIGVAISFLAGLIPARMAARVEPADALAER
jgi:putative ABC transport system permease protein